MQACEQLDSRAGLPRSQLWPPEPVPPPLEGEEPGEPPEDPWEAQPTSFRLAAVLDHLRARHHHCVFCGAQASGDPSRVLLNPLDASQTSLSQMTPCALFHVVAGEHGARVHVRSGCYGDGEGS